MSYYCSHSKLNLGKFNLIKVKADMWLTMLFIDVEKLISNN